eukprot:486804-Prymnesium_polylepis.1
MGSSTWAGLSVGGGRTASSAEGAARSDHGGARRPLPRRLARLLVDVVQVSRARVLVLGPHRVAAARRALVRAAARGHLR